MIMRMEGERKKKSDKFKNASTLATKNTQRADMGAAESNFLTDNDSGQPFPKKLN